METRTGCFLNLWNIVGKIANVKTGKRFISPHGASRYSWSLYIHRVWNIVDVIMVWNTSSSEVKQQWREDGETYERNLPE